MTAKSWKAQAQSNQNVYTISKTNPNPANIGQYNTIGQLAQTSLSPITITGTGGIGLSLNDLTLNQIKHSDFYKKYEIIESQEDILVLSCTWYRLRKERDVNKQVSVLPTQMLDNYIYKNIIDEDRNLAVKIRDYYSKKMMMLKLKGINFTNYRNDLNQFIHSEGTKFEEKIIPLVYKLPEFYVYDDKFDEMISDCKKHSELPFNTEKINFKLEHLGTLKLNKRISKKLEYWFKNEDDHLVEISIEPNNPLLQVWNKIVINDIVIEGNYSVKKRDDIIYYNVKNFCIV